MKNKRILLGLMLLIISLLAVGCGGGKKASDTSIDQFQASVIKEIDDEGTVNVEEANGGYVFSYKKDNMLNATLSFEGEADKNKMIRSVTATCDSVNVEYFMEMTASEVINDVVNASDVPVNKLAGDIFLTDCGYAVALFSPDPKSESDEYDYFDGMDVIMAARKEPQKQKGWQYTVKADEENDTVTVVFDYVGE